MKYVRKMENESNIERHIKHQYLKKRGKRGRRKGSVRQIGKTNIC